MNLLKAPAIATFKPFKYPRAYEFYELHESMHWMPKEIPLGEDVKHWNASTPEQQAFIHSILNLFTQSDVQVGSGYNVLLRIFKPTEIQMALSSFAARECVHMDSYSLFQDTIGLPETTYSEFLEVPEMVGKMEYIEKAKVRKYEDYEREIFREYPDIDENELVRLIDLKFRRDVARMLAVYGALTEGMALFSSFAMLLNNQRFNKFPGLCQIVTWSIRDEEIHCQHNSWLFRTFINENLDIWDDELKKDIYSATREMVTLEDAFIDLAFDKGVTEGLDRDEMKQYIRYIADRRLIELGLKPNFGVKKNPLRWMEDILNTPEFANFFETRSTEYAKASLQGSWDDVRANLRELTAE